MEESCLEGPMAMLTPSQARLAEYVRRKQEEAAPAVVPESVPTAVPKSVFKVPVEIGGLPSPGSAHGSRIVIQAGDGASGSCTGYVASGPHIYSVKVPEQSGHLESGLRGKGGLLLPLPAQGSVTTRLDHIPHRTEVQALAIAEASGASPGLLGSIDAYGRVVVAKLPSDESAGNGAAFEIDARSGAGAASTSGRGSSDDTLAAPFAAHPRDAGVGEGGWAGLAFMPGQASNFATARFWAKRLDLYDRDMHVRSLPTLQNPTALKFLAAPGGAEAAGSALLAVAEGPQLSVWDLRMGQRGGCIQRISVEFGGAPLYALDCADGIVGVAGASRCIYVFDTRRWTCRSRWSGCLKYEVTGMHFSTVDPGLVYVNGLDYEVVCGTWDRDGSRGVMGRRFAFRGDSRWLGVHKAPSSDVIGGWTDSSNMFVVNVEEGFADEAAQYAANSRISSFTDDGLSDD